jgi:hypothetical protein
MVFPTAMKNANICADRREWEADLQLLFAPTMRAWIVLSFTSARLRLKLF